MAFWLNLGQIQKLNAKKFPETLALRDKSRAFTYPQMNKRVNQLAQSLYSQGLQKGDKVAVLLENSIEIVEVFLATAKTGIIIVPINFRLVSPEVEYIVNNSDAKAIIVTTPQEVALADVRKSINFCKTVRMDIFGLIENMSGLNCPHCGEPIDLFGAGGGERTAEEMGVRFLGRIPFDPNVVACGDSGACYQEVHVHSAVTKAFTDVAQMVSQSV